MSSFLVIKKNLELSAGSSARMLVGKQNRAIPEQILPEGNSIVTTMKKHFDFGISYDINPANGQPISSFWTKFPSGKYDPLSVVPSYAHHRFLGWHTQANDVMNEYAVTSGDQKVSSDNVDCFIPAIYGNWQAATSVILSSQMQSWNPEMDHDCFVGQQYGELPLCATCKIYDAEVEYLESTGTQWIDTGISQSGSQCATFCDFKFNQYQHDKWLFGDWSKRNDRKSLQFGLYNNKYLICTATNNFSKEYSLDRNICKIMYNGETSIGDTIFSHTITELSESIGTCLLFGKRNNVNETQPVNIPKARIYRFIIADCYTMTPILDFIPVRKGNVGYMYDRVSGKLFGNQGTGTFSYGNDVSATPAAYRNLGWYTQQRTPDKTATTAGSHITSTSLVSYRPTLYALWQLPTGVQFDATTNGGEMPSVWVQPNYYADQPYEILPQPTHPRLSFGGWYLSGNLVDETSTVPLSGASLIAQYVFQTYTVDMNGEWQLEPSLNPDSTQFNGAWKSFSNSWVEEEETMAKIYIDVVGYRNFSIYIGSSSEQGYDYTVAMDPDIDPSYPPYDNEWEGRSEGVKASTAENTQCDPADLNTYVKVDYQLDGGRHRICVVYRKDSSVSEGDDCGYLVIPKPTSTDNGIYLPDLDDTLYDEQHENEIILEEEEE